MTNNEIIKKLRRQANVGLYGSIVAVCLAIIFHYLPFQVAQQTEEVRRWMLIAGIIMAVLTVVAVLMTIRKTAPRLRLLDNTDKKLQGYASYISNLYISTFVVVLIESALIILMSDTSLLMIIILLVLLLFLSYPNMYKMRNDLNLTDEEMKAFFGDQYIPDPKEEEPAQQIEKGDEEETANKQTEDADKETKE